MANQVQIPVIQHPDPALVQVQQNTNKVLRNLNNQINAVPAPQTFSKTVYITTGSPGLSPAGPISNGTVYTLLFQTKQVDTFNSYNSSTGIWTCPVTGVYDFNCVIWLTGSYASYGEGYIQIRNGGGALYETIDQDASGDGNKTFRISATASCNQNDTLHFTFETAAYSSVSLLNANYTHWMSICQRP